MWRPRAGVDEPRAAIAQFIATCRECVDPREVREADTELCCGDVFCSYAETTGGHKTYLVLLMGPLTEEMLCEVRAAVAGLYQAVCEGCGATHHVHTPHEDECARMYRAGALWQQCRACAMKQTREATEAWERGASK